MSREKEFKLDGRPKKVRKPYKLYILGPGQFLGEEEWLMKKGQITKRQTTAVVTQTAIVHKIDKEDLVSLFKGYSAFKDIMQKKS